jgi:DmsE family decaheme c-type cytochrome
MKTLRRGNLYLSLLLIFCAPPVKLLAVTPPEAARYGFSTDFGESVKRTYTQTASVDLFSPNVIPSPVIKKIGQNQSNVPSPGRDGQKFFPKAVLGKINTGEPLSDKGELPSKNGEPAHSQSTFGESPDSSHYGGDNLCLTCHSGYNRHPKRNHISLLKAKEKDLPKGLKPGNSCELCHGPGKTHAATGLKIHIFSFKGMNKGLINDRCIKCHKEERNFSAHEFQFSPHATGLQGCTDCHSEHYVNEPYMLKERPNSLCLSCHREVESDFSKRSHHPLKDETVMSPLTTSRQDSKLKCVDCHNPHGSDTKMSKIHKQTKNTCTKCHPSTRGPFFFEHRVNPGSENNCSACHLPHGSSHKNMLISEGRALCMSCHGDRVNHNRPMSCYTSNCHSKIHGSNKDILFRK